MITADVKYMEVTKLPKMDSASRSQAIYSHKTRLNKQKFVATADVNIALEIAICCTKNETDGGTGII